MKKLVSATAAAVALSVSAPAVARDRMAYVGIEAGALIVEDIKAESDGFVFLPPPCIPFCGGLTAAVATPSGSGVNADLDTGFDLDAVAGYDWGYLRTEAEVAYRSADFNEFAFGPDNFIYSGERDGGGNVSNFSLSANFLGDLPLGRGFSVYAGPGFGWTSLQVHAKVKGTSSGSAKLNDETEDGWMIQGIAGFRKELSGNVDVGVKYRFIRTNKRQYDSGFLGDVEGRLTTHSILASFIYNFGM